MKMKIFLALLGFLLSCFINSNECLILNGEFNSKNGLLLHLAKFGFQKTAPHEGPQSEGYIYGNVTSNTEQGQELVLVLLPRQLFFNFYSNGAAEDEDPDETCSKMFEDVMEQAYDARCHDKGVEDFVRHVPCPKDGLCWDEDDPNNVIKGSQLTYAIQNVNNPKFWYLSLVACRLNANCSWEYSGADVSVTYNLALVNGKPPAEEHSMFEYHFSSDRQGLGYIIIFCLLVYGGILMPLHVYIIYKVRLPVIQLFTGVLSLQTFTLLFASISQIIQGSSGQYVKSLDIVSEILLGCSESLFLLLLLLLAKGWAVTNSYGQHTVTLYVLWVLYNCLCLVLYIASKVLHSVVEDTYHYSRWSGILSLVLRCMVTVWYLCELRATMVTDHNPHTLHFLLQLGAATLVWLIYLPLVALIGLQVSPLWRPKLLAGFRLSADLLAHMFMAYILYPLRSDPYIAVVQQELRCDELDLLDQAPHVLHRRRRRGKRLDSFGRRISGGSNDLDEDECIEFDRLTSVGSEGKSISNGNHFSHYDYSEESASKYKIQVSDPNKMMDGEGSYTHYNPLSSRLLDPTQQDSLSQLDNHNDKPESAVASLIDIEENKVTPRNTSISVNQFGNNPELDSSFDELTDCSENDVLVVVKEPKELL